MGDFVSPWHPITDPLQLKALGKLCEELAEALSAASRCIIQGIDEKEPTTGKPNRLWLQEEIADVKANIKVVEFIIGFDDVAMEQRVVRKYGNLLRWHAGA